MAEDGAALWAAQQRQALAAEAGGSPEATALVKAGTGAIRLVARRVAAPERQAAALEGSAAASRVECATSEGRAAAAAEGMSAQRAAEAAGGAAWWAAAEGLQAETGNETRAVGQAGAGGLAAETAVA